MDPQAKNFHHPYSPYDIQLQFMQALYDCLEGGKVAVFESPTGEFASIYMVSFDANIDNRYCMCSLVFIQLHGAVLSRLKQQRSM